MFVMSNEIAVYYIGMAGEEFGVANLVSDWLVPKVCLKVTSTLGMADKSAFFCAMQARGSEVNEETK